MFYWFNQFSTKLIKIYQTEKVTRYFNHAGQTCSMFLCFFLETAIVYIPLYFRHTVVFIVYLVELFSIPHLIFQSLYIFLQNLLALLFSTSCIELLQNIFIANDGHELYQAFLCSCSVLLHCIYMYRVGQKKIVP